MTDTLALYTKAEDVFTVLDAASAENLPPDRHTALMAQAQRLLAEAGELLNTATAAAKGIYGPMFAEYGQMMGAGPASRRPH